MKRCIIPWINCFIRVSFQPWERFLISNRFPMQAINFIHCFLSIGWKCIRCPIPYTRRINKLRFTSILRKQLIRFIFPRKSFNNLLFKIIYWFFSFLNFFSFCKNLLLQLAAINLLFATLALNVIYFLAARINFHLILIFTQILLHIFNIFFALFLKSTELFLYFLYFLYFLDFSLLYSHAYVINVEVGSGDFCWVFLWLLVKLWKSARIIFVILYIICKITSESIL